MTAARWKYNPGFFDGPELKTMFCVRTNEFDSLVETLRQNADASNQHTIVIGPRGSGKTTLLRRIAVEISSDCDLSARFFPVVFAEESYEVSTCGEFWLEALSRLALQVPDSDGDVSLRLTLEELRREQDDRRLGERCLSTLLDFSRQERKKLALIVENLDMMFLETADPHAGWRLRKTLQTEPRILLMGSAVSRFGEIDRPDRALYDLFRDVTLHPLDQKESAALWASVSGRSAEPGMIRSLQILTGGNPRLLAIVAGLGADLSVRDLTTRLLTLVDEHTGYFKNHLEALPHQERRVYLALAALWHPSTAREVAERARLNVNTCSAQIRRLQKRGVIAHAGGTARRKQYCLAERMYNIYYLIRTKNDPDNLVDGLVAFMMACYSKSTLKKIVWDALSQMNDMSGQANSFMEKIVIKTGHILGMEQEGDMFEKYSQLLLKAHEMIANDQFDEAFEIVDGACDRLAEIDMDAGPPLHWLYSATVGCKSALLEMLGRADEAMTAIEAAVERLPYWSAAHPKNAALISWVYGDALLDRDRWSEAIVQYETMGERMEGQELSAFHCVTLCDGLLEKAAALGGMEREKEQAEAYAEATKAATATMEKATSADAALLQRAHEMRAFARLASGDIPGGERDLAAALKTLADMDKLEAGTVDGLINISLFLEPLRMAALIRESGADRLLLPLVVALELEGGEAPRVAREVKEVAGDVQRRLAERRRVPKRLRRL